jgi:Mg-chelatase subunit ChlD
VFGGIRFLELMLVLDSSKSLYRTDPKDYRAAGAIGLLEILPSGSAIRIGVVDFDAKARLVLPLTADRAAAVKAIRSLDRDGRTNLAAGIRTALEEFGRSARPESSRVILLFTDGKSDEDKARRAMQEARAQGVAIHALLLGATRKGAEILAEIAQGTGGSFVRVTDPAKLPEAFLDLRTTGVERVTLRVNESSPVATRLAGGTFVERVPLQPGENHIVAAATSLTGETREHAVTVTVSGPLAVEIESPADGTVVTDLETEAKVEGRVEAFSGLPMEVPVDVTRLGVRSVVLKVDDTPPFAAELIDGRFSGRVLLRQGTNRIRAVAETLDGRSSSDEISVQGRARGCAELEVSALRDGQPALSISERAVEVVVDGSNSMWGRIDGRPKISVAKEILQGALEWLGNDVTLALRAYGHHREHTAHDCTDSQLLVPFGSQNREQIRQAIGSLKPKGQTPLAYALSQIAADFAELRGERAVVLVTDGIESCGGDPQQAARILGERNTPVHVIGFGLSNELDENPAGLKGIADVSGGRFILARSAEELREALAVTVGTPFRVLHHDTVVAEGALGSAERIELPEGRYLVRLESEPPQEAAVTLASEQGLTLSWERAASSVKHSVQRRPIDYTPCGSGAPTRGARSTPAAAPPASPSIQ